MENGLPKEWKMVKLGSLNKKSKTSNINPYEYPEQIFESYSVPVFETGEPEFVKGETIRSGKQMVKPGDVLICKINPRINRVWVVNEKGEYPQIGSTEWIIVSPIEAVISPYLVYACSAKFFRILLISNVSGVGGSLTRARPKEVYQYEIPLPPSPNNTASSPSWTPCWRRWAAPVSAWSGCRASCGASGSRCWRRR